MDRVSGRLPKRGMKRYRLVKMKMRYRTPPAGMTSRTSPPSSRAPLVRSDQDAEPGRIAEPGVGHVHHDRGMPMSGRFEKPRPELGRGGDIDLGGGRYHRHAADHLDQIADVRHCCPPPAQDADPVREPGGSTGDRREPGAPDRLARQPFLHVRKLRGSGFLADQHGYRLTTQGLRLFPRLADIPTAGGTRSAMTGSPPVLPRWTPCWAADCGQVRPR